jgi:cysteine desulfurase
MQRSGGIEAARREENMKERIYLDHAATTPVDARVLEAMQPYFGEKFANPSAIYTIGKETRKTVEEARRMIASTIGARPEEIIFTSGGTESDNWAVKGVAHACRGKGHHLIVSSIEHHAVLYACEALKEEGYEITYLPVDEYGRVDLNVLAASIREDTILISVMAANNEIGTIQPLAQIGRIAKEHQIVFHVDAVAAYGQIPLPVDSYGIDLLSVSGHKIYGPKGIGFLYVRNGVELPVFVHGGGQESGMRSGTENVPGIVGIATAATLAYREMRMRAMKESRLRNELMNQVIRQIPGTILNGHPRERVPGNLSFCFPGIDIKKLLLQLDEEGISASVGSACAAGHIEASHVMLAIGREEELARECLRLTLGKDTTREEMIRTFHVLKESVMQQRRM